MTTRNKPARPIIFELPEHFFSTFDLFVIRQEGTDNYLPEVTRNARGGYSHNEPMPNGGPNGPRVHPTFASARNALTAWRKGVWVKHHNPPDYPFGEEELYYEPDPSTSRYHITMEIVGLACMIFETYKYPAKEKVDGMPIQDQGAVVSSKEGGEL